MSNAGYEELLEMFRQCLSGVAMRAGREVVRQLCDELWRVRERLGGRVQLLEKAVGLLFEIDRQQQEKRGDWLRLRRDVMTSADPNQAKARLSQWWIANAPKGRSRKARRLLRKNPPELDACREVFVRLSATTELKTEYLLRLIATMPEVAQLQPEMARGIVDLSWSVATGPRNWPTRVAAFELLGEACRQGLRSNKLLPRVLQQIMGNESESPWVRAAALRVFVCLDFGAAMRFISRLFEHPGKSRDAFLSRRAFIEILLGHDPVGGDIVRRAARSDPSPAVRQKAILELLRSGAELGDLLDDVVKDPSHLVRGAWALALPGMSRSVVLLRVLAMAQENLASEQDATLLAVTLRALGEALIHIDPVLLTEDVLRALARFAATVAELAASREVPPQAQPWWWLCVDTAQVLVDPEGRSLLLALRDKVKVTPEGRSFRWPASRLPRDHGMARKALCCLAAVDFGLFVGISSRSWAITRGQRRSATLWRVLHELRHPSYDKRQGHPHWTGSVSDGDWWFAPLTMAEVTRTRIPGERVIAPAFGHWVPQLPGPTEAVNAASRRQARVVVPGAQIVFRTPSLRRERLRHRLRLAWLFADLDGARFNALRLATPAALHQYLEQYQRVTGQRLEVTSPSKAWEKWLGLDKSAHLAGTASLAEYLAYLQERAADPSFFLMPFTNELWHLGVFLGLFGAFVLGTQSKRQWSIRSWRRRTPLCIGGWGSRGKSGTERLKAALFHGLGYRVFSKTTGTLPMFVSSIPGLDPVEVPIYRPYDKATIWEQTDMLRQASGLEAQVFLWECMALKPRYVSIMTHDWMTDDFATVTNTYPDHEDIQGPTGYDVAHSISTFIPKRSHLVTSELQGAPVLVERCRNLETSISVLPHATWHLISKEFLDRYPYLEHPANIGLVMELGAQLGVSNDVALAVMADFLLADIGALRQYPTITVEGARLDFTNIMSANERAGFISSFERLALDQWKDEDRLATRVVLYVNNREDRPARSHVFAKVVVEDTPVHAVVVVGTATHEFAGLVDLYLDEYLSRYRLPVQRDEKGMVQWLETLMHPVRRRPHEAVGWVVPMSRWLGVPQEKIRAELDSVFDQLAAAADKHSKPWTNEELDALAASEQGAIEAAVDRMLDLSKSVELRPRYVAAIAEELAICAILTGFARNMEGPHCVADRPDEVTSLVKTLVGRHLVIIDNPTTPGPQLMKRCLTKTVPGAVHHFVGMQNIKGPGLAFVNLWAAIETMVNRCRTLLEGTEHERNTVLEWLAGLKRPSPYEVMIARDAFLRKGGEGLKDLSLEEKALFERMVGIINEAASEKRAVVATPGGKILPRVLSALDNVIDYRDSVSRRLAADATLRLLALGLISHPEAALRLDKIYDRQKKGPLSARLFEKD
ncbi:MAG: hypothetical protein MUC50_10990 [Myxococcota bacterium]|jgi:poly-gamma-glutamate synthase PgsB/CapB|nr:hypothetical protein [Myxococcota bacterium]